LKKSSIRFKRLRAPFFGALGGIISILAGPPNLSAQETVPLDAIPHIHAIAENQSQPDQIYLATHTGLFLAASNGEAVRVSENTDDLMGLVRHPTDPSIFFASGRSSTGGKLGVLKSIDGGKTWSKVSDGVNGPVDFHAMAISRIDPNLIYGASNDLQVSHDGGRNWEVVENLTGDIFDIATSADDANTLFAATRTGLYLSLDKGKSWQPAHLAVKPVTMVDVSADGRIHAFIYGVGLITAEEKDLAWKTVSSSFQDRYLLHLITNQKDANRLYAVANTGIPLISKNAGKTWASFENNEKAAPELVAKGEALFQEYCQSCHGERGVGERPNDMYAKDEFGFVAPPLDDSAHGWHHSDQGIVETILNGSERNERMIAWKETLSRDDAENLVAYIKSLWNFRSIACQGSRHMNCMN